MANEKPNKERKTRTVIQTPEIVELQAKLTQARKDARIKAEEKFIVGIKRKINMRYIELNSSEKTMEEKTVEFKNFLKTLL